MTIARDSLTPTKAHVHGISYMILASFFFAAVEITSRFIESTDNSFQTVWIRYLTHLIFMLLVFGPHERLGLIRTKKLKLQLTRPLTMIGMPLFFIGGILLMPAHDVWAIFWLSPLMVLGLAAWLLKEKIGWQRWIGGTVCVIAVWLVMRPDRTVLNWVVVLPLGMAFCYSLYRVMTRMLSDENSLADLFYSALVVFVPLSLALPYFWEPVTLAGLIPRVFIGFLGYATLYCLDKAYEIAPAAVMAPFSFSQVPFLLFLALIFFHEIPGKRALLGCAILIVTGVFLFVYEMRLAKRAESLLAEQPVRLMSQLETNSS